jgi:small subunit ribosomal protein S20
MAHNASARKRNRQNKKRNSRNRSVKHAIKTYIGRVESAFDAKDFSAASREFQLASKRLDKAAARRILHPNTAARTKSRLAVRLAALQKSGIAPAKA